MLLNIIKNCVFDRGSGPHVRNLLHNLLAVVSGLVEWAGDVRLHTAGTCQQRVSTLCLCICVGLHAAFSRLMEREGIMLIRFITGTLGQSLPRCECACARECAFVRCWMSLRGHRFHMCPKTGDAVAARRASENIPGPFLSSVPKANTAESLSLIPFSKALSKLHLRAAKRRWKKVEEMCDCREKDEEGREEKEEMKRVMDDYRPDGRKSGRK